LRIVIFGTGGVGGYFGGRLAQAGEDVIFIARGEHLRAIREQGLRVESAKGDFTIRPAKATADLARAGLADCVLVATKAWQVPEAAEAMRLIVGPGTFVVPLQNGIEAPAQLAAILGAEHVLGGLCRISSFLIEPGLIRHSGLEPSVVFGELDNRPSARVERLKAAFDKCVGLQAEIPADIHAALWAKFIFIVAVSGVGALTRVPMGVYRRLPESRQLLEQALGEAHAIALAKKIPLAEDIAQKILANIDASAPATLASMQRDIMEGRPSELEAQTGAIVRLGLELGVPTPMNTFIYNALLPQEKKARGELILSLF
jgi:2-dehydropantoate 2-reductase